MRNVKMIGTGVYIPKNKVYNEELDKHFEKQGLNAHNLMKHLGRRKRYFISDGENAISMCIQAIDNCMVKNNIAWDEIEMVLFCSDTPEYLTPSNAVKIVGMYGKKLKNVQVAFDINANCTSMIQGLDIAAKYMKMDKIEKALVVGSFCISPATLWSDTVVYANFADAAACVALNAKEEKARSGFLDTKTLLNASLYEYVTYPKCGMSKVPLKRIEPNEKRLEWNPFSLDMLPQCWAEMIRELLERNSYVPNDIDYYIFSQLSDKYNMETLRLLELPEGKYHFVGSEYGYTGNTCPVLCLNRMWDVYAKSGNKIVFCTVGAGSAMIAQLYQF